MQLNNNSSFDLLLAHPIAPITLHSGTSLGLHLKSLILLKRVVNCIESIKVYEIEVAFDNNLRFRSWPFKAKVYKDIDLSGQI